ncbi:uncharacterized protein LOC115876371 [Sitophilus oryzae]|uniref:Uncharacterized protein LOC115876371 n=1 Tax=Sitophilus oryzae TaxID=7048 RepID=A0A6J2XA00_SITOR|nr:uncharacterized protein LOC115876371 [Sitophilus oryzae]XP_030748085.1 uncharacterized protein LOC115876371 [Sitophilus oryzae]
MSERHVLRHFFFENINTLRQHHNVVEDFESSADFTSLRLEEYHDKLSKTSESDLNKTGKTLSCDFDKVENSFRGFSNENLSQFISLTSKITEVCEELECTINSLIEKKHLEDQNNDYHDAVRLELEETIQEDELLDSSPEKTNRGSVESNFKGFSCTELTESTSGTTRLTEVCQKFENTINSLVKNKRLKINRDEEVNFYDIELKDINKTISDSSSPENNFKGLSHRDLAHSISGTYRVMEVCRKLEDTIDWLVENKHIRSNDVKSKYWTKQQEQILSKLELSSMDLKARSRRKLKKEKHKKNGTVTVENGIETSEVKVEKSDNPSPSDKEFHDNKNVSPIKMEAGEPKTESGSSNTPKKKRVAYPFVPPRSPHNLIEELLYHDPWSLLVATIFLNKTSCSAARPFVFWFLDENPNPHVVLKKNYEDLETYFGFLGLQKIRSMQVWRMSYDFLYKDWTRVSELYGVGQYGEDAFRMFCLGDFSVEPKDRYLKIYKAWYQMQEKQQRIEEMNA